MTQLRDFLTLVRYMTMCVGLVLLANLLVLVWVIGTFHWGERILALLR